MQPTLKLGFTDTIAPIADYFIGLLSKRYNIIHDVVRPDYLIFGDSNFGNNNTNFDPNKCIKIFYTGENQRPTNYVCHYSISFDHDEFDGKNYRLPLYVIYDHDNKKRGAGHRQNRLRTKEDLNKHKFCSFVVQNPNGQKRNQMFQYLNTYQPVASGGPLYNNIGYTLPRGENSIHHKLDFLSKYKFNLCFENSSYPGYATEKLYEALIAKTIPLYWGSPTAALDFNPKAFVNWHDYGNDNDFINRVIELNSDPDKYAEMFFQPMFVDNKEPPVWSEERFLNWFSNNVYKGVLNAW